MTDHSDENLLEQARAGDPRALGTLVERYSPMIYRFGMKMCRDEEDARDVVQDTLLAVARNISTFRGQSSLSTWLYSIARSFCIKQRRRNVGEPDKLEPLHELRAEGTPELVDGKAPDERAADNELERALEHAIGSLEPMYREVLVLRDVEGLTAPEVARVLELSVEAVKSRLHRARAAVRRELAPLLAPEPTEEAAAACPDIVELLSRHLENDISPEVCQDMERHVESCTRCAARCDSLRKALVLCRTLPAPDVPEELKQLVQARLRDALSALDPSSK